MRTIQFLSTMALVDPLLSSPPAGQTSFISFSQQVARARTTCMKDFVTVRLRQESGAAMTFFWGEKVGTIGENKNLWPCARGALPPAPKGS